MATATTAAPTANDVWSIEVKNGSGGGDYVLCPAGNHPGTIVGLFDIGHQDETNMKGEPEQKRKLVLAYELAKKRPDGKPFVLAREYTWSMGEKANFYKDVVNVTGISFKEGDKFNPLTLMALPVMVSVKHTGGGEKTYHNVSAVTQFPEGFPAPEPTIRPVAWSVLTGEPFPPGSDWLPFVFGQSIFEKAEQSREAKQRKAPQPVAGAGTPGGDDADIPF